MKKVLFLTMLLSVILISKKSQAQLLPESYQATLNEIVDNFEEIRGSTSLNEGKNSLRLLSNDRIILRINHKKKVKTLTFTIKLDEEGNKYWVADNKLTTDMVNKYEKDVTKILNSMLELSREKAKL